MNEVSPRGEATNNTSCPSCGNKDAWHGVITEPGDPEMFACDECGHGVVVMPDPGLAPMVTSDEITEDENFIEKALASHRAAAAAFDESEWADLGRRLLEAHLERDDIPLYLSQYISDLSGITIKRLWSEG
ncbi:hypothetical protein G5C66_07800 [Nocardioides sp. KC13]|uniref:Uncharacterized protein n=1 Tax=Nocardioides turkmenicus TaxID=2711220 RepID=A0A6M1QY83_9ACTN|nr:hypothetical protein [Nocardioides sp. KC13]NGN92640.1 hypothetical protein [Nocardioides sp. KC13]